MSDHDLPCGHSAKYAIFGGDNGCLACSAERLASERDAIAARLAEAERDRDTWKDAYYKLAVERAESIADSATHRENERE